MKRLKWLEPKKEQIETISLRNCSDKAVALSMRNLIRKLKDGTYGEVKLRVVECVSKKIPWDLYTILLPGEQKMGQLAAARGTWVSLTDITEDGLRLRVRTERGLSLVITIYDIDKSRKLRVK